jgi:hypothetical protein
MQAIDDVKASWNYLRPNVLKVLIATIGSIGLVLIPVFIFTIIYAAILMVVNSSPDFILTWSTLIDSMIVYIIDGLLWLLGGPFVGVVIAGVALFACLFSAVYILSGDIVLGHFSSGLGAILWLRHKFIPLTITCFVNIVVAVMPPVAVWYALSALNGFSAFVFPLDIILGLGGFLWLFIVLGFLQLHIPAIIDNVPIIEGLKQSIRSVRANMKRVFGVWAIFVIMLLIWFIPYAIYVYGFGGVFSFTDLTALAVGGIAALGVGFDFLFFIPMIILLMTKIYHDTKEKEI